MHEGVAYGGGVVILIVLGFIVEHVRRSQCVVDTRSGDDSLG